jgi:hypothetical protein
MNLVWSTTQLRSRWYCCSLTAFNIGLTSAARLRNGYLRGALSPQATQRQMDVLAAYVAAGGSVQDAAALVGIQPSSVKRH